MSASDPPRPRARRVLRRLALWLGVPFAVLVVLLVLGIPIPLVFLQGAIESLASEALGREVRAGDIDLVLGVRPALEIDELRIAHGVEGRPDLLQAEHLELEIGLPALLARRLRIRHADARNVSIRTDPEAFPEPGDEAPARGSGAGPAGLGGWGVDVLGLSVANVRAEIHRQGPEPMTVALDELEGRLLWDEAIELGLAGRYKDLAVALRLEGGPVGELVEGAQDWPLRMALDLGGNPLSFEARLATAGGVYRIDDMQGRAEETTLTGWLALEDLASTPKASGSIHLDAIGLQVRERPAAPPVDAAPPTDPDDGRLLARLLAERPPADREKPGPVAAVLTLFDDFETDLALEIARITGLGPSVEDLSVALRAKPHELRFPVSLTADGIPLSGTLEVDERDGTPHLAFRLAATDFRVDELAASLRPDAKIEGPFRELSLEIEGSGHSARAFLETLSVRLRADDAQLSYGAERRVPFEVDLLELSLEERGPLSLQLRGALLGEEVRLDLAGGTVAQLIAEAPWPLELEARGAGATLELAGQATGSLADLGLGGSVHVHGERLSSLEPWLGTLPVPDAPYRVRLEVEDLPEITRVSLQEVSLGETKLVGEVGERRDGEAPLAWANLRVDSLDLSPWVKAARREPDASEAGDGDGAGIEVDVPILPGGLRIVDADLDVGVGRLVAGDLELEDLGFRGSFRDGFLPDSSFRLEVGGARFEGAATIDLREPPHSARFRFGTTDVDVGRLLERLRVARGVEARAGSLRIEASGDGSTLGEILRDSDVVASLEKVRWNLRDPNSDGVLPFALRRGELRAPGRGEPTRLSAEGSLGRTPVKLSMQTEPLSFFERPADRVPLDLTLEMAGATLEVRSTTALPIERADLRLGLTLRGRSLADASTLLDYELPAIGPYELSSELQLTREDYRIEDFDLRVGRSRLRGRGHVDTRGVRPRVTLELKSDRVQLDDFAAAWGEEEGAAPPEEPAAPPTAPAGGDAPVELLSPEGLMGFDGRLDLRVAQVLSGQDELGSGRLTATLENGKLEIEPLHLELPGGPFDLRLGYAYQGSKVAAQVRARTEQFDYAVLARRVQPDTDMEGWLSLDLDVAGEAEDPNQLLASSSGHLDFLAAPRNFGTDVFDLWAVSLLSFLLPRLDSEPRSTLNCVVARFDLRDGVMRERALLLDTTGMVVRGDAEVDFGEEHVWGRLEPQPKAAAFLSLQTGVEVEGSFEDFGVSVPPEELVGTLLRFVTSVVVVPLQRLVEGRLPADGEETCRAAWLEGRVE